MNKGVLPYWVKLVRAGNQFSGYESTDGQHWTRVGSTNVAMGGRVYAGLVTSSHQKTTLCTATLDNVAVTPGAAKKE